MSLTRPSPPGRTLVIPVYNAESFLARTLEEVASWLAARPEAWELILVDDASTDGSPAILDAFRSVHASDAVTVIRLPKNRGKGYAVRSALAAALGEFTIFTDCDLAYPLANIDRVLTELDRGTDAAIACRVLAESTYLISPKFFSYLYTRHIMGRIFNWLCRILTVPRLLDTQAGLKGFRTDVVRSVLDALVVDGFPFDVELLRALIDRKASIREIPVSFRYDSEPTTVRFTMDALIMLRDLLRIRVRSLRGAYRRDAASAARSWPVPPRATPGLTRLPDSPESPRRPRH